MNCALAVGGETNNGKWNADTNVTVTISIKDKFGASNLINIPFVIKQHN
jgi:hypothetical protein